MPYIKNEERLNLNVVDTDFEDFLSPIDLGNRCLTPGELNYLFSTIIIGYVYNNGECYQTYNDIIGALECAKLELYRRKISPYEDKKIQENGDL